MSEQELLGLLIQNISYQLRHQHYDRTVEVGRNCHMMTTGKGQDEEITKYKRFAENLQLQNQRVALNIPMTPVYVSKPGKMFKKMSRVDGVRRDLKVSSDKDKAALEASLWNFQPGVDIQTWLVDKIDFLQKNDPNAWILYDRYDRRTATMDILKTDLRPVVFRSVDVLNFGMDVSGVPDWVLFRDTRMEYVAEGGAVRQKQLETFYLYAHEILIRAREVGQKTEIQEGETLVSIDVLPIVQDDHEHGQAKAPAIPPSKKTREFYISTVVHGAGEVPAFCIGAYPDAETDQQTFVSWFWDGMPVLKEVIRDQNMHCVHTVLEAFRRRYEFSPVCEYETDNGERCGSTGRHGWIQTNEGQIKCPGCGGSGLRPNFTTEQEVIRLSMPETMDKVFELSKLAFVEPVDTTLLEYWDKKMDVHKIRFDDAIFGDGMYKKPTGSQQTTATETNERTDMAADILRAFGLVVSKGYELAFRALAGYREVGPIQVNHSYPEQIDLLTLEQEIANFAAIQDVDIYEAKVHQRHRIIAKQFEGEPETHRRIAAWYQFLPFDDKSPEATAQIIASLSPTDDNVILWTYWLQIRREVDAETPNFHTLTYEQQKRIVDAKVQEFKGRIELAGGDAGAEPPNFNTDPNADNPQPAA